MGRYENRESTTLMLSMRRASFQPNDGGEPGKVHVLLVGRWPAVASSLRPATKFLDLGQHAV